MCGIAGLWERDGRTTPDALAAIAAAMTDTLVHRGPDAGDIWLDPEAGLALGHRRLSIIDLSPAGAQPMVSSCGRFVVSYNGEVYNADELRPELEAAGRRFRGHSDTEVIVEGAAVWGVEATVKRLIGMFAMALWDRRERTLYLVRDRLGIKPLYWAEFDERLLFGSELKALRADRSWSPELDRDALLSYLRFGYVPAPDTIYRGVRKLPPGTILRVSAGSRPVVTPYWSLQDIACQGQSARFSGSEDEAAEALDALLRDAVRRRMVADVPLGAFLSGGIDSSTVVALMQAQSTRPVRTFSIGFHEREYNEGENAAAVARHLGTEHTELYAEPRHALDVIPRLADMYDEPFANSSQIPTYLVSKMTRAHVTVALSGDGGDELFAGYTRYFRGQGLWRAIDATPQPLRALAARGIWALSPSAWSALGEVDPGTAPPGAVRRQDAQARRGARRRTRGERVLSPDRQPVGRPGSRGQRRARTAGAARGCTDTVAGARFCRAHAVSRYADLSSRRHSDQGRSRVDGRLARGAGAVARPSRCRVQLVAAAGDEGRRRRRKAAVAPRAPSLRAARTRRPA